MGNKPLSADRRAVLSSIALAGLAGAIPAAARATGASMPVQESRLAWEAALAAYRRAHDELDAYERGPYRSACVRLEAARRADAMQKNPVPAKKLPALADLDMVQGRFDDLVLAKFDAIMNLCRERAPDLAALQRKLDVMIEDQLCEADDIEELIVAVREDVRRLAGSA